MCFNTYLRWSASAREHVHTRLPYRANGCADCVQILCVTRDPLNMCFNTYLRWSASARAQVHTPFQRWGVYTVHMVLDLANGWADCVQIWFVARNPLD